MIRTLFGTPLVVAAMWLVALASVHGQNPAAHDHEGAAPAKPAPGAAKAAPQAATPAATPEIFCSTMKTGMLCSHGTSDALGLAGTNSEVWVAAIRKYNRAVNEATQQLQAEAKLMLTPSQMAEVQRWFGVGLNPQMNALLEQPVNKK